MIGDIFILILKCVGLLIVGFVVVFVLVINFGDEIFWNFQATGDSDSFARNTVTVKVKSSKKKGTRLEIRQKLKTEFQNKNISVMLNGAEIATIDKTQNNASKDSVFCPLTIDKPKKGQILILKIDNIKLFSGRLS